jgi:hypothetical protein
MTVWQAMGVGHMDSLNVILTKYRRVFPDTKLRLGLFVKVPPLRCLRRDRPV